VSPAEGLRPAQPGTPDALELRRQLRVANRRRAGLAVLAERVPAELVEADRLVALLRWRLGMGEAPPDPERPAVRPIAAGRPFDPAELDTAGRPPHEPPDAHARILDRLDRELMEATPPAPVTEAGRAIAQLRTRDRCGVPAWAPTPEPAAVHHVATGVKAPPDGRWPHTVARPLVLAALPGRRAELLQRLVPMPAPIIDRELAALSTAGHAVKGEGYGATWSRTRTGDAALRGADT